VPCVPASDAAIDRASAILREGGVVAFPTETVYGLGADARSERACARIFEIKGRPRFDPLIVHVLDASSLADLCVRVDERARALAAALWPGPLTLVLPKSARVPDIVTAGEPTVAVRAPSHSVARALLAKFAGPIAAPSANPFGYVSPTRAEHVDAQLGARVDLLLDGGPSEIGIESTIVDLSSDRPALLRSGGVDIERIEAIVGPLARATRGHATRAPGQLESHYAPRVPLTVLDAPAEALSSDEPVGLLAFRRPEAHVAASYAAVEVLSATGDLREAAANLFASLRSLDSRGLARVVAEPVPDIGIGVAIRDRLARAAARRP
jgi:L-threonylcarbamoyladenylate synthase